MSDTNHNEICRMDAVTLAGHIRARRLSPVEVIDAVLDRMDKLEPILHAFCTPTPELARETAQRLEADITAGRPVGSLAGVPIGIKDLVLTPTTAVAPFTLGIHGPETIDGKEVRSFQWLPFTFPFNM